MTYPFVSESGILLKDKYSLDLDLLEKINTTFSTKELKGLISLYITEGVPYAFKSNPLIFEEIRNWLGNHLNIEAKSITITGSSRIGFSLHPEKWGKPHRNSSDLDFIIVSKRIFEEYKHDFKQFASNLQKRINNKERISAIDLNNIETITRTISNSRFIDQFKIPINKNYPSIYKSYDLLAHLVERMKLTTNCPKPYKASVRVYENWQSCFDHINRNIKSAFKHRKV